MVQTIQASTTIPSVFARVRNVVLDEPGSVLSDAYTAEERHDRRFRVDLKVGIGAGASVHQEVTLQLGIPRSTDDGLVLPLTWHATGRERLLPTFEGELQLSKSRSGTSLCLSGWYSVPLGVIGRFGDLVAGRRLARRSLGALAERIATRLDAEVARRLKAAPRRQAPYAVALQEGEHSEMYIG